MPDSKPVDRQSCDIVIQGNQPLNPLLHLRHPLERGRWRRGIWAPAIAGETGDGTPLYQQKFPAPHLEGSWKILDREAQSLEPSCNRHNQSQPRHQLSRNGPNQEMESKTIIVTGSSRGIGLAVAKDLLAASHKVVLVSRSAEQLQELKEQFLSQVAYLAADMTVADVSSLPNASLARSIWLLEPFADLYQDSI